MNNINAHLYQITKANEDESLAIFVGAGVSKSSENISLKMPSWSDLISGLMHDLDIKNESDFLKIAQLYFLTFKEHQYYKKIKEFFPDNIPYSKIHEAIFDINPHVVITTNWDDILESAIIDKSYFYSIIASDKDLMKSSLDKKLVKMHGDFKNHNIVFKEDDYINYKKNFPLVENYVKSVMSTHTVIFIGYSYNDIDLKQIIKWTQSHSEVRPPMFLVTFEESPSQIKYLENHGITTLVIRDECLNIFENSYSNKLYNFLMQIKRPELTKRDSDKEVLEGIYEKLKNLQTLDSIISDQITKTLTNCELKYIHHDHEERAFLKFYKNEITSANNNRELRSFYDSFIKILDNEEKLLNSKKTIEDIFSILHKADIYGIITDSDNRQAILTSEILKIPPLSSDSDSEFDFTFKLNASPSSLSSNSDRKEAYVLYTLGHYEQAYIIIERSVSSCLKNKDYTGLFISLLNKSIILNSLKYNFNTNREHYSKLEEPRIKELYESLPKAIKDKNSTVYDLVTFNYLNRMSHEASNLLTKYQDANKTKTKFLMDSDKFKCSFVLKNLINFTNKNGCLIDIYTDYKYVIRKLIEVKISSNIKNIELNLNKIEIYSCIKYMDLKSLNVIFKKENNKWFKFNVDSTTLNWLINTALENIKSAYLSHKKGFNPIERQLLNVYFMISHCSLSKEQEERVLEQLTMTLKKPFHNIAYYDTTIEYLTIRFNRIKNDLPQKNIIEIIDTIIDKITLMSGGHEKIAIIQNGLHNLYIIAEFLGIVYDNEDKVKLLLSTLKKYPIDDKIQSARSIMYGLFRITKGENKKRIKRAMSSINLSNVTQEERITYELFLVATEITLPRNDLSLATEAFIDSIDQRINYSSNIKHMQGLLRHIVKKNNLDSFSNALKMINRVVSKFDRQ
ncbi:SIR2 family protein [Serratia marcescens]|uniref:SIR2 family protein n=1 Tax=Serratia marcescens TaxID=615 RepID=UPI001C3C11F6|nr:SIR2 family protein [Serratia marcescens]HBH6912855.1 SIR2 family protein [Serratia marcescens]